MKKLLLTAVNARFTHSNLAIRYLRNRVSDLPYEIEIVEFSLKNPLKSILERIWIKQPEILAISVYIWNVDIIRQFLLEIKKIVPSLTIILGGPEVSFDPESWIEDFPQIDFIVCGAGESGFRYLLENDLDVTETIIRKTNPLFNQIRFPYSDVDFPDLKDKYIYYESSRGCAYNCIYCLSSRLDQKLDFRDLSKVKRELLYLIEQNVRIIKFVDRTFNIKFSFSRAIWNYLIDLEPQTKFHFEIHPDLLKDKDFEILMKAPAGLFQFEVGVQSVNSRTISEIERIDNWQDSKIKIKKLIEMGNIHIHLDILAGLPLENITDYSRSFDQVHKLNPHHLQVGFLKILKGTELSKRCSKYEMISMSSAPYQVLKNRWLDFADLLKIQQIEKIIDIYYNPGTFKTIQENLIPLFTSPFELYADFAIFLNEQEFNYETKNWQINGKLLMKFCIQKFADKTDFFVDCLRWDWCKISESHFYPLFIRNIEDKKIKKINYEILNRSMQDGKFDLEKWQLKSAIFFTAKTEDFKKKYLPDDSFAAFIKKGENRKGRNREKDIIKLNSKNSVSL
ncbi:MAG: DUF4080 domain-containing protein [Candidatus Cloacimonetes bacterium]|nr:DUF4080 domain-containing protein [Candidatus Cloacimonadota bacterium]